jgi:heat shock protein HtpX
MIARMVVAFAVLAVVSAVVLGTAVLVAGFLGWLAILVAVGLVEGTVLTAFGGGPNLVFDVFADPLPVIAVVGLLALPVLYLGPVREQTGRFRTELRTAGTPAAERHPELADTARKLAQQAGVPEPEVRITNRSRPESYAISGASGGTIVLSRGVVRSLDDEQLTAVLAHEISHLANGDSRLMDIAVVPMLVADRVGSERPPDWIKHGLLLVGVYLAHLTLWAVLRVVTTVQYVGCRLGVTVFSRGREFAADRSAATLTGSPAALASALRTLDEERGTPRADARELSEAASALDILPQSDAAASLLRTHPDTETRIERLRALEAELTAQSS